MKFFKKIKKYFTKRNSITFLLYLDFIVLGSSAAVIGPTLKILSINVHTERSHATWFLTGRSIGGLLGSVTAGLLFDKFNHIFLLFLINFLGSFFSFVIPYIKSLVFLVAVGSFQGLFFGSIDVGCNLVCLDTWGEKGSSIMQALHFFFGLGAFIAPLLVEPFLPTISHQNLPINNSNSNFLENDLKSNFLFTSPSSNSSSTFSFEILTCLYESFSICSCSINCPYIILGVAMALVSIAILVVYFIFKEPVHSLALVNSEESPDKKPTKTFKFTFKQEIFILSFLFLFFFCYVGLEFAYGLLIASYCHVSLHTSLEVAASVTAIFWGFFTFGRFISIFIARCASSLSIVIFDLVLSGLTLFFLCFSPLAAPKFQILIISFCSASLGLGLASVFPSGFFWINKYVEITGKYASFLVVGGAAGEMAIPIIASYLLDVKKDYFIFLLLFICILALIIFIIVWSYVNYSLNRMPLPTLTLSDLERDEGHQLINVDVKEGSDESDDHYDEEEQEENVLF